MTQREAALAIVRRLRDEGHKAYWAGGAVRDMLLGHDSHDFDIATDALPERVIALFPKTRKVGVQFGRVDVKASRLGLAIDFSVATPSATLAVRGTAFRIEWDAIRGYRARGIPGNRIRAIEIEYLRGLKAMLSKADSTSEQNPMPAFDAFWSTYIVPLEGAITPEALDDPRIQPTDLTNPVEESGLKAINQLRGGKVLPPPREGPDPVPPTSDNPLPQKP